MSYSFTAGQGGVTPGIGLVRGAGLTQQEGPRRRAETDRTEHGRLAWRGTDSTAGKRRV